MSNVKPSDLDLMLNKKGIFARVVNVLEYKVDKVISKQDLNDVEVTGRPFEAPFYNSQDGELLMYYQEAKLPDGTPCYLVYVFLEDDERNFDIKNVSIIYLDPKNKITKDRDRERKFYAHSFDEDDEWYEYEGVEEHPKRKPYDPDDYRDRSEE